MDRVRASKWKLERRYVHSNTGNRHDERRLAHAHTRKQHMNQHNGNWRSPIRPKIIQLECVALAFAAYEQECIRNVLCDVWGYSFVLMLRIHLKKSCVRSPLLLLLLLLYVCFIRYSVTSVFQC